MRILGLDIGDKRIGLAVSDTEASLAQGIDTLTRKGLKQDIEAIKAIAEEYEIRKIVAGLPLNMNGSLGEQAKRVISFIDALKEETDLPVETWDERLSSSHSERILLEADISRKKRKQVIDRLAAQIILQSYLDARA